MGTKSITVILQNFTNINYDLWLLSIKRIIFPLVNEKILYWYWSAKEIKINKMTVITINIVV